MAKQALQFGDKNGADVRLHLVGSTGEEYGGNPIFCHSPVLKKSEFFQAKLSERWSSDKPPFEIKVTISESNENYIKCIQLMYSYYEDDCFYFSDVDEALSILPVASELMFHDCLKECMLYLDAVRWNPQQKVQLRDLLTSLQINTLPALAARLGMNQPAISGCGYIEILKESLQDLLSLTRNAGSDEYRSIVEKRMVDYFDANASPAVKDGCRYAILKEFTVHIEILKSNLDGNAVGLSCSALSWLIDLIQQRDRKLLETVLKMFCEDKDLRKSITGAVNSYQPVYYMLHILIDIFLKAMGNGIIITPASFRASFLTNWVDVMVALLAVAASKIGSIISRMNTIKEFVAAMEKGIADVADTLSLVDQKLIYNIWKNAFTKDPTRLRNAVKWWSEKVDEHKDCLI